MSDASSLLSLPYIQPNQAQKHVTHNDALRILDTLVQASVIEVGRNTPPTSMMPGDAYVTGAAPVLDWAGQPGQLVVWDENYWRFYAPRVGWVVWDANDGRQVAFDGTDWIPASALPAQTARLGINTGADQTNRLAVSSEATLLTHAGSGHQVKVNKSSAGDTASLLFQTGYSGRAEMGTAGSDDFEIKTSADGSSFHTALQADAATGTVSFPSGVSGLTLPEFGTGNLLTTNYSAAKGLDLMVNGTGLLGNNYNLPSEFAFDPSTTPNLPGAFTYSGYFTGMKQSGEFISVDPNRVYRLGSYLRQDAAPGDWSAFAEGDRHRQFMGLLTFDVDKNIITAEQHMRFKSGGVDSMTTLSAPLTPGDMVVHLADASGWNDASSAHYFRGLTLFGYKNSMGARYTHYSRHVQFDLFETSGVDKIANTVTLNTPFPAALANPDDPNGTWPAGTSIANSSTGNGYKYALPGLAMAASDTWYKMASHMGGVDTSGTNVARNFPPGTAYVKVFWLPNFSNVPGGSGGYPDTGAAHGITFAGVSVVTEPLAALSRAPEGWVDIKVPQADFGAGTLGLVPQALDLDEV